MNFSLLQKLCEASGVPGAEEPVKAVFRESVKDLVDEIREDALGNLLLHKRGEGPRVLLDAHLDEVAFLVAGFEGPFLRVLPLGGMEPQTVYGQRLIVWGKRPLSALVATRPPHLGEEKKTPAIEEMLLDVGLAAEQVKELVSVGDPVTFPPFFEETEEAVLAKALDDRVGLFLMVEALK
ncbi:MAG: M42 family metallopeptidase, partial [Thermodesulfobacteria bacterium]|nr:M42 family metallopeptidase [Thermodesulfobacteriota bacterium]